MSIENVQSIEATELCNLRYFKNDAVEALRDNKRVIAAQKERIAALEYHLYRCRESAYQMWFSTVGMLPGDYAPDAKPAKKSKKAQVQP